MIESKFIYHDQNRLHYITAGDGDESLLFFHGFGQDHTIYLPLIQALAKSYRIFIFDLYFHGQSVWAQAEKPLEKGVWKNTMAQFLGENNVKEFSLVGFSLGGKFALATVEAYPDRVKKLFLLAPDGIKTSFWYSMATYPLPLRKFFRGMINSYNRFLTLANILNKLKLVDKGLVRFADFQMGTEEKRKRVYYSWVVFRHLTFNIRKIAGLINDHDIQTIVIVGRYDKVIVPENMKKFLSYLKSSDFHVLESGHGGLIYQSLPFLQQAVKNLQ